MSTFPLISQFGVYTNVKVGTFPSESEVPELKKWEGPISLQRDTSQQFKIPPRPSDKDKARIRQLPLKLTNGTNDPHYSYDGAIEEQNSRYVVLKQVGDKFIVYPVDDWYTFRKVKTYKTLTIEEAEEAMGKRKTVGDRSVLGKLLTKDMEQPLKQEEEDADFREALFEEDSEERLKEIAQESDDESGAGKKKQGKKKAIARDEEDEDEEKGEAPDYDGTFADDEETLGEDLLDEEVLAAQGVRSHEGPKVSEEISSNRLSKAGREMKKILRKTNSPIMSSDEEDKKKKKKVKGDVISMILPPVKKAESTKTTKIVPKRKRDASTLQQPTGAPLSSKHSPVQNAPPTKKPKVEGNYVTEDDLRRSLLLHGKIRTVDFLKIFKDYVTTQNDRKRFAEMMKKIGTIVEEGRVKYLTLKQQ